MSEQDQKQTAPKTTKPHGSVSASSPSDPWSLEGFDTAAAAEWNAAGIRRAQTARQWASAGLKPEIAGRWYDLDLKGPADALLWISAGFEPQTARPWVTRNAESREAHACVSVGFSPEDFRVLSDEEPDVEQLAHEVKAAGLTAEDLRPFLDRNVEPFRSLQWAEWCRTNPLDTAFKWSAASFEPSEATRWINEGFVESRDAQIWSGRGYRPDEAAQWVAHGVTEPRDLPEWLAITRIQSEIAAWISIGVNNPKLVHRLILRDVDVARAEKLRALGASVADLKDISVANPQLAELEEWLSDGRMVHDFLAWIRVGFTPQEAAEFQDAGHTNARVAQHWRAEEFGPLTSIEWMNAGFENPKIARQWLRNEINPHTANLWIGAGVSTPKQASKWATNGFTFVEASRWRAKGMKGPTTASRWDNAKFSPSEASLWVSLGIDAADASALRSQGVDADYAKKWTAEAKLAVRTLSDWLARGIDPDDAIALRQSGFTTTEIFDSLIGWEKHGFTMAETSEWRSAGAKNPTSALKWANAKFTPTEAAPWISLSIGATNASVLRSNGFDTTYTQKWITDTGSEVKTLLDCLAIEIGPDDAIPLFQRGLSKREVFNSDIWWDQRGFTSAETSEWRSAGAKYPASALSWANANFSPTEAGPWISLKVDATVASALCSQGVDADYAKKWITDAKLGFESLLDWFAKGINPDDAIALRQRGHTTEEISDFLSRAEVTPGGADFQIWFQRGRRWMDACRINVDDHSELLHMVHELDLDWADPAHAFSSNPVSFQWLEEIQNRAKYLTDQLQREPRWPVIFEDDDLQIILDGSGKNAVAWVGNSQVGGLVSFDMINFDVYIFETNPSSKYLAGLAIAWFIDCCIVLQTNEQRDPPFRRQHGGSSPVDPHRKVRRYVPLPSFINHQRNVSEGQTVAPAPHWVDGHARNLPQGHSPSPEARDQAPARIRPTLKPNQTWVNSFERGGLARLNELRTYLSRHSALADAMATSDRPET